MRPLEAKPKWKGNLVYFESAHLNDISGVVAACVNTINGPIKRKCKRTNEQ